VVLTFSRGKALLASRKAALIGAASSLAIITMTAAYADTLWVGGCVGGHGAGNCVLRVGPAGDPYIRTVPAPENDAEKIRATERDHRWLARCRPIIAQDQMGVPRYHYAAPGCEFGVIE
jgi:hypothetical protein